MVFQHSHDDPSFPIAPAQCMGIRIRCVGETIGFPLRGDLSGVFQDGFENSSRDGDKLFRHELSFRRDRAFWNDPAVLFSWDENARLGVMKQTRRSLFALMAAPAVALAQAPTINATTQVRGLPAPVTPTPVTGGPYDSWTASALSPDPNGTLLAWSLGITPRKINIYLNGVRQFASTEVNAGVAHHFTIAGNLITFTAAPQAGDHIVVETTL